MHISLSRQMRGTSGHLRLSNLAKEMRLGKISYLLRTCFMTTPTRMWTFSKRLGVLSSVIIHVLSLPAKAAKASALPWLESKILWSSSLAGGFLIFLEHRIPNKPIKLTQTVMNLLESATCRDICKASQCNNSRTWNTLDSRKFSIWSRAQLVAQVASSAWG